LDDTGIHISKSVGCVVLDRFFKTYFLTPSQSQSLLTSNGSLDRTTALVLAMTNLEKALGVQWEMPQDLGAYPGGDVFEFEAKVGVISETLRRTDLFV